MVIEDTTRPGLEINSFTECPDGSGLVARRVEVCNPDDISGAGSVSETITNLSLPIIDTEVSHALVTDLKQLLIRNRSKAETKISFTIAESGTKYITLNAGAVLTLEGLKFSSKILYIQSPKVSVIEILELS